MKHKMGKLLLILLIVVITLVLGVVAFLKLCPSFGGRPTKEDSAEYASRSVNYHDGKFFNVPDITVMNRQKKEDVNKLSDKDTRPKNVFPIAKPQIEENLDNEEFCVTWFGHSSILVQMHGLNILIDPVFSKYSSPVSFTGVKRYNDAGITIEELPHIDILLLSHDHYDHMDYQTILKLQKKVDSYIVPLGVEKHLERWKIPMDKVITMAWWEEIQFEGLTIGCTPAQHFSGRGLTNRNETLWASWVFKDEYRQVFESGDTGYGPHFKAIHDKYGDFDFVMLDGAQYDMSWESVHMFPEESIEAVKTLGAKVTMPVHWGTFCLAYHAWDDSIRRFVKAGEEAQLTVITPLIGQTVYERNWPDTQHRWWEGLE